MKIIADSSADLLTLADADFTAVPLKLITSAREYVDDDALDVHGMLSDLRRYKGKSGSSCPNIEDYLRAFGEESEIFCITITSGLSGSCNSAETAAREYLEKHPDRKVSVLDSLSAGAELTLVVEKLRALIQSGLSFEEIDRAVRDYMKHTNLIFALESLHNLAANGRVSPLVAKFAGILGIRIVGRASERGVLEITNKSRGAAKMNTDIYANMKARGYAGGRVRIHHAENPEAAEILKSTILTDFPDADITIGETRGLCSFYAELGGLMIGYESK